MEEQLPAGINLKDKKTIAGLVGLLLLLVAIPLGVYLAQQKQIFKPKASELPIVSGPETSFSIYPVDDKFIYEPGYYIGEPRIFVKVKSDIAAANLFVAKLKFPANLLEVAKIDKSNQFPENTFVKNWIETTYDNNAGTISLVGGVPAPGFQTQQADSPYNMVHIIFKPKAHGVANITFDSDSAIYRNSDNINILERTRGATFTIIPNPTVTVYPTSPPSTTIAPTPCNDLALNKPVASSGFYGTARPERAVDGNDSTEWTSDRSTGAWLSVDLGSIQTISSVKVKWHWDDSYGNTATGKVQVSQNNQTWTDVATSVLTKEKNRQGNKLTLTFDPVQAKYVRFYASQLNGGWMDMRAFEAYSSVCQSIPTPTPAGIFGDINSDGVINLADMSALLSKWGKTGTEAGRADLNGDGVVNAIDYSKLVQILLENGVIKSVSEAPPPSASTTTDSSTESSPAPGNP